MGEEFKQTPSLTFEPFDEEAEKEVPQMLDKAEKVSKTPVLSAEEQRMVDEFAEQIDLGNTNLIVQYGAGSQKKMAEFSESALGKVRTKDLGEIGDVLTGVVTELKNFDVNEEEKGLFSRFKRAGNRITAMKTKYDKAEVNVEKICTVLEEHQIQLLKDISMLDKMYELNKVYYKELSMYILAGKKKLEETRSMELPILMERATATGLPEDAQAAKDLDGFCNRFEKKLYDLELTRMISVQMAPQIRLVQNNNTLMSDKIQSTLVNTIPLWKSQMVLALGIADSQQAAKAQRAVSDMTNELLRKNADTLKMATIETEKEAERGIVDIETLTHTNQTLIETLDEMAKIQEEGRQKRREAESELLRIEEELKQKLLEIRR